MADHDAPLPELDLDTLDAIFESQDEEKLAAFLDPYADEFQASLDRTVDLIKSNLQNNFASGGMAGETSIGKKSDLQANKPTYRPDLAPEPLVDRVVEDTPSHVTSTPNTVDTLPSFKRRFVKKETVASELPPSTPTVSLPQTDTPKKEKKPVKIAAKKKVMDAKNIQSRSMDDAEARFKDRQTKIQSLFDKKGNVS